MRFVENVALRVTLTGAAQQAEIASGFRCAELYRLVVFHLAGDQDGLLAGWEEGALVPFAYVVLGHSAMNDRLAQGGGARQQLRGEGAGLRQLFKTAPLARIVVDAQIVKDQRGGRGERRAQPHGTEEAVLHVGDGNACLCSRLTQVWRTARVPDEQAASSLGG